MKLFSKFLILLVILLTIELVRIPVFAQELKPIDAQITKFNDYYRFTFKSNNYIPFDLVVDGNDIIIDFESANALDMSKFIYDNSIVKSFGSSGDGKSYVIKVNASGAKVRKFIADDNTTGFDLFASNEKSDRKLIMMSSLPDNNTNAANTDAVQQKDYASVKIITYPLDFVGPPKADQNLKIADDFIGPPHYDQKKYEVYELIKTAEEGSIIPDIAVDDNGFKLSFPLTDMDSVSAAAITKDGVITIIFNTVNSIQLGEISENPFIKKIYNTQDDKYKIIKIVLNRKKIDKDQYSQAFYKDKFSWTLELYKESDENKKFQVTPLNINAENNFGEKRLVAEADSIVGPVTLKDESTGADIKAFLIKDNATGIVSPREFVDIKFLPSLQGIFLEEKSDYLAFNNTDKKFIATKLSNMQISDDIISADLSDTKNVLLASAAVKGSFPANSIFPFPAAAEEKDSAKKDKDNVAGADKSNEEKTKEAKNTEKNEKSDKTEKSDKGDKSSTAEKDNKALDLNDDPDLAYEETIIEEPTVPKNTKRDDITVSAMGYVNQIIYAPSDKAADLKLDLANFYFQKKFYAESLGILEDIKTKDPNYKNIFQVNAMMGATQFLTEKYGDAYDSFSALLPIADKNKNYNEIRLWQWASKQMYNLKRRNNSEVPVDIDFVSSFDKFMQQYPLDLRYRMGLMYVDQKIKAVKLEEARNVMDVISFKGTPSMYKNDTRFYNAYLADKAGNIKLALKLYDGLTHEVDDRKNRARALFELTKIQLLKNQISNKEAIEKFLEAATIWRDDYFEIDVLEIVGHLYVAEKNYVKALENWRQIANNFPETTESLFILGKMRQLFVDLFDGGIAYKMKPLDALDLYFGFRELTPAGDVGDRITRKVAQFFITADMMDEAIKIIEHQIKYRSFGDEKAKLVLWLYKINIDNRDLDAAESVLNLMKDSETSPLFVKDKKYDQAMIAALRGQYQKALDMVKGDFSSPAQKVRTELFWQKENWFGVMTSIESRLKDIRETKPLDLTKDEMNDIKRLIVAYSAQNENKKLENIKVEFLSRVSAADDLLLFEYLTKGTKNVDYNNFNSTVELNDIERFLNAYSYMPTEKWSSVIKILQPKVALLVGRPAEELSRDNKLDIVKLAIAYSMYGDKDEKIATEMKKNIANLARDFKDIKVDRSTIDAFNIFDDKFMPKENDAVFEGKIKITDIADFVKYYKNANKFSELNIAIRDKFKN